eukprot:CAMPEP_0170590112 /NCGR_PEP_ID=MMETSP0224-20130122/11696_1 /TAXON_ID=285029 /ORGANISM="Togula jolla, Strain CCCM 725" /LENGTH=312 /DNA_ID=CAMNT_0010913887 /DNA_START=127 /DNA_END=1065 /DNA_ORIENTATION=-
MMRAAFVALALLGATAVEQRSQVADSSLSFLQRLPNASQPASVPEDGSERACGMLWFYHIPKTGGMAVRQWMDDMVKLGQFDEIVDLRSHTPFDYWTSDFHTKHIAPLVKDPKGKLIAVHVHMNGPGMYYFNSHLSEMKQQLRSQGCDLVRTTFLRQPKDRAISAIFYSDTYTGLDLAVMPRSDMNQAVQKYLMEEKHFDNQQLRYLLNNRADTGYPIDGFMELNGYDHGALEAAKQILSTMEYIAFTEDMQAELQHIGEMFHAEKIASVEVVNAHSRVAELISPQTMELIEGRIQGDQAMFDIARKLREEQ